MARVLLTGITGQDGGYLAERLAADGDEVHGMVREEDATLDDLLSRVPGATIHHADLDDHASLLRLVQEVEPDELYNLAGISSVGYSWEHPVDTARLSGVAVAALLDAAWQTQERTGQRIAFLQASSAEIFGLAATREITEETPVAPVNPYGAAKAYAHHMVSVYRARGLHAASCILFNHESPRRPEGFVTRKITSAAARIARDGEGTIQLGNLAARRDWGWAPDYVDAMILAARHEVARDFVVATGQAHSVAEFAEVALRHAGVEQWEEHVATDASLVRPTDAPVQVGDASRARRELGWQPTIAFEEIVRRMVDHDVALLQEHT